ncbi:MAG: TIGR02391 family protein [Propionibacterium sp.]|nr:TIGR02391 family protein [Propionibacterium sp.]
MPGTSLVAGSSNSLVLVLSHDDVRNLPLPDLSLKLLASLSDEQANFNNVIQGFRNAGAFGDPLPQDMKVLLARLSDAWAWLEAHALIGPSSESPPTGNWQRPTSLGHEIRKDGAALAKIWAADRLAGDLHEALTSAVSNFALGDYETAAFAAMKAVEVEVRRVAGLPNELLGVPLMRKAFNPKDGVLRDPEAEGGEQQAAADLFAGAIGAYKNPASHRTVQFEDPVEAAEVLQLADLLLRIVSRAEGRLAR